MSDYDDYDQYVGEIRLFAGTYVPQSWLACDGAEYKAEDYPLLYAAIGTAYGGSGQSFNVPELRGRLMVGAGNGPGLTPRRRGAAGGTETVALEFPEMPQHRHRFRSASARADLEKPSKDVVLGAVQNRKPDYGLDARYLRPKAVIAATATLDQDCLASVGEGKPHENRMPCQAIFYIIAAYGTPPIAAEAPR